MARLSAALALLLAAAPARAALFGRDKVASRWTARPLPVNGDDADWDPAAAFESDGIAVAAMNDGRDLYLTVTAHTRDGRDQLTGEAREDVALWFLTADGKTRRWGALLPFSRRSALTGALEDPAGADPAPELALASGPAVSTAAWPAEVATRMSMSARRPVWELRVPLKRLSLGPQAAVAVDLSVSAPGGALRAPAGAAPSPRAAGVRRPPDPVDLNLSVRLAPEPPAER